MNFVSQEYDSILVPENSIEFGKLHIFLSFWYVMLTEIAKEWGRGDVGIDPYEE